VALYESLTLELGKAPSSFIWSFHMRATARPGGSAQQASRVVGNDRPALPIVQRL